MAELAEDLKTEYRANGRRSLDRVEDAIDHLLPVLGTLPAIKVTSADVRAYQAKRQTEGAPNATINRECAALKRMFSVAVKGERLHRAPHIGMLQEHNVRTGFFEDHQYEGVRAHLPAYAQPVATFAYITGWRVRSEVLTLQWRRLQGRYRAARSRHDQESRGAHVRDDARSPRHPRDCLLYTSPSPRDRQKSRMPSSA